MAIPENHDRISTNLPPAQLERVLEFLKRGNVQEVPGTASMFAESGYWEIELEGARYEIGEFSEEVNLVSLISAKPVFVQALINEHEVELEVFVRARDYDKAKITNNRINHLKRLLPSPHVKPTPVFGLS